MPVSLTYGLQIVPTNGEGCALDAAANGGIAVQLQSARLVAAVAELGSLGRSLQN
jgi:hypothetical protein